jgi:hypothetical protein
MFMNTNKWIGLIFVTVLIGASHGLCAAEMHENTLNKGKVLSEKKTVRFADRPTEDVFQKNNSFIVSPIKKKRRTQKGAQSQPARNLSFWYCWACRCS